MIANRPNMLTHKILTTDFIVTIDRTFIGVQRHFAVDNQVLVIGQINHEIGIIVLPVLVFKMHLFRVMFAFDQPRRLQRARQLDFSPAAQGFLFAF